MPAQVRQTSHIIRLQIKTNPLPKLHVLLWNSPSNSIKTFNKTLESRLAFALAIEKHLLEWISVSPLPQGDSQNENGLNVFCYR